MPSPPGRAVDRARRHRVLRSAGGLHSPCRTEVGVVPVQADTGRVRRLVYVVVSAVALCGVVSVGAAGCGRATATPKDHHPSTAAESVESSAPVTHDIPADVVPMVLPVTGADTRWTQGLDAFLQAARYSALRDCVRAHGLAMPDVPPPMFVRYMDIPDLAYIRAHGFA